MENKLAATLIVTSGIIITSLIIANREQARKIKILRKGLLNATSALDIVKDFMPHLVEQMPDTIMLPEKIWTDMEAYSIMIENDL